MKRRSLVVAVILGLAVNAVRADVTLEYALTDDTAGTVGKKISISRFFARVDSSDRPEEFLLFQAGKFFPLYRVSNVDGTYTMLTSSIEQAKSANRGEALPVSAAGESKEHASTAAGEQGPGDQPSTAPGGDAAAAGQTPADPIVFRPTRKMDGVAGVKCRIVLEIEAGTPAVEHCMANKAGFGITERESRTLARLFVLARAEGYGWLGAATPDEDFVSVRSKTPNPARTLELLSVSRSPLEPGYLRIPSGFRQVEASAPPPVPQSLLSD